MLCSTTNQLGERGSICTAGRYATLDTSTAFDLMMLSVAHGVASGSCRCFTDSEKEEDESEDEAGGHCEMCLG